MLIICSYLVELIKSGEEQENCWSFIKVQIKKYYCCDAPVNQDYRLSSEMKDAETGYGDCPRT